MSIVEESAGNGRRSSWDLTQSASPAAWEQLPTKDMAEANVDPVALYEYESTEDATMQAEHVLRCPKCRGELKPQRLNERELIFMSDESESVSPRPTLS